MIHQKWAKRTRGDNKYIGEYDMELIGAWQDLAAYYVNHVNGQVYSTSGHNWVCQAETEDQFRGWFAKGRYRGELIVREE